MNYLQNYILEQQVVSPSIFSTPTKVLRHLLFVNGNGCEIEDGNFFTNFSNGKKVMWDVLYKTLNTREECIDYLNEYHSDREIEKYFNSAKEFENMMRDITDKPYDEDFLWKEACNNWYERYKCVSFVDEISWEQLLDKKILKDYLNEGDYYVHLGLSSGYFKAAHFTEATCTLLKQATVVLSESLVEIMKENLASDFSCGKESPIGGEPKDLRKTYLQDIDTLNKLIVKLGE